MSAAEERPEFPPTRTIAYLAALITDLPGNSVVVITSRNGTYALAEYENIVARIEYEAIAKVVRANGRQHTVLTNGTTVLAAQFAGKATRGAAADLVLIAGHPEDFDDDLARTATSITRERAGAVRSIVQDVDITTETVRDGSGEPLRTTTYGYSADHVAHTMAAIFGGNATHAHETHQPDALAEGDH
ncbi:hypothetical protein ACLBWP_03425 [Microbacterium sp. M1A1_1b]